MFARLRNVFLTLACATAMLLAGCGGGGGTGLGPDPTVFFIDASADAGLIDFLLNNVFKETAMDYLDTSTDFTGVTYVSDESGGYDLVVQDNATGDDYDAENRVFSPDTHSVIVALGLANFATGEELKRLRSIVFTVDRNAPTGNKARLYVVHAFVREAGQATPQIKFQNAGANPQFFTSGIDFGGVSSIVVDSGTMDWWAKREDATGDVVYASATYTLDPSSVYVVLVSGIENDPDVNKQPKLTFIKLTTE
jgi:hypothetical protein